MEILAVETVIVLNIISGTENKQNDYKRSNSNQ